jgi:hypothetical protein
MLVHHSIVPPLIGSGMRLKRGAKLKAGGGIVEFPSSCIIKQGTAGRLVAKYNHKPVMVIEVRLGG